MTPRKWAPEDDPVSIWLTLDGGTIHYACGPRAGGEDLVRRYQDAGIAQVELVECCDQADIACAFDVFGDDDDPQLCRAHRLASEALAVAEDRSPRPFSGDGPCALHGLECVAPYQAVAL